MLKTKTQDQRAHSFGNLHMVYGPAGSNILSRRERNGRVT